MWRHAFVVGAVLLGACVEGPDGPEICSIEEWRSFLIQPVIPIDLLIVVDRTPSMAAHEESVAAGLRSIAPVLELLAENHPLHIGVISSEAWARNVPGCSALTPVLQGASCLTSGRYLTSDPALAPRTNAEGSIAETLACMASLPISTCPVNQPITVAVRAIDGSAPENDGFRRPGAKLGIVIISDRDDCSLIDPEILAGLTDESAIDAACSANAESLVDVDATLAYLLERFAGGRDKFLYTLGIGGSGACATAAPRLDALEAHADLCSGDWSETLRPLYRLIHPVGTCIDPTFDIAPTVPGLQTSECIAEMTGSDGVVHRLPWCTGQPGTPCLRAVEDNLCESGLSMEFEPGGEAWDTFYVLNLFCAAECPAR